MIQIQSTWFPLYDRNPQTFVPNIFDAKPSDYQKAQISVFRSAAQPSGPAPLASPLLGHCSQSRRTVGRRGPVPVEAGLSTV